MSDVRALLLPDVGAVPATPASGGVLYSSSALPTWRDANGNVYQLRYNGALYVPDGVVGTPASGGVLYSNNGVPTWVDSGGHYLGMVKSYAVNATGSLSGTVSSPVGMTEATVPGCTQNVVVSGVNATAIITGTFDCQGAALIVGHLNWAGADVAPQAIFSGASAANRATVSQTWRLQGLSAGTYTAALKGSSATAAVSTIAAVHTGMTIIVIDQ